MKGSEYHTKVLNVWETFGSKKIVLKVKEVSELKELEKSLEDLDIPYFCSEDFPLIVIGPEVSEKINSLTGHLKLLS